MIKIETIENILESFENQLNKDFQEVLDSIGYFEPVDSYFEYNYNTGIDGIVASINEMNITYHFRPFGEVWICDELYIENDFITREFVEMLNEKYSKHQLWKMME
jgi:hypothetical protein